MKQFIKRKSFVFMFFPAFFFLVFSEIEAQVATPKSDLKPVDDVQKVQPEKLKGVPSIAPKYKFDNKKLPDLGRSGVNMLSQRPISLKQAIFRGLENNIDIEVIRQDIKISKLELKATSSFYEPRFIGQSLLRRATTPDISIFSPNTTMTNNVLNNRLRYQAFFKKLGTSYAAELNNQRLTTDNPISILSPQNNASFKISITQPLLRGLKFDNQRRLIGIAKRKLSLTDTQFRQKAIEVTLSIQHAYWDLAFALKNLQVQRDGVRDAKRQLEHSKRLVANGVLAPVDVVAVETQVANIEQNVYLALERLNRTENLLKNLISGNRNDEIWSYALVPTDSIKLNVPQTTLKDALELALNNRPELESNRAASDINEIDQKYFREQSKPQIDLTFEYTSSGISGSFNNNFRFPFPPTECQANPSSGACRFSLEALNSSVRQSAQNFTQNLWRDITRNRYPTYQIGVTVDFPLFGDRKTEANLGKALAQAKKINYRRRQLEQLIQMDVRNSLQSVTTAKSRLRSASIARENSEKQYASEQRKFRSGLTDTYRLLDRQTALMKARSAEIRAQTELNKSIAELQRATGNSLKANNVETKLRK